MKFENKSKSLKKIDKNTVREVWDRFVEIWKEKRIETPRMPNYGEVNETTYPRYIKYITGHEPCLVCNGPRNAKGCIDFPVHTIVSERSDPDFWNLFLGSLCEHGFYVAECHICWEAKCKEAVERVK